MEDQQKAFFVGFQGKRKTEGKHKNKKTLPLCNFCGEKIARQEITKVSGGVALSCFDCIPRNHFLPWIISRKEM
ncbi:MAG: hypothetical protein HY005_01445 [Candidatus Staskawiczbacteria bacterium]|nr:hypothetical protein [Candidatus Staskawiczbacteria bacterium]